MQRSAIFVDAGYLFAQGSALITGRRRPRHQLDLDISAVHDALLDVAYSRARGSDVLRTYWYDGAQRGVLTPQHASLAETDGIKLRLGMVDFAGEQKGVDPLIVTDMIELARNGSVGDIVLLSGDEDVRVGVMVAQTFGVRVHLLGVAPSRASQSRQLRMEADTLTEWDSATVSSFLGYFEPRETDRPLYDRPPYDPALQDPSVQDRSSQDRSMQDRTWHEAPLAFEGEPDPGMMEDFMQTAEGVLAELLPHELEEAQAQAARDGSVHSQIDRRLMARCRRGIGRDLDQSEKRALRKLVVKRLNELLI